MLARHATNDILKDFILSLSCSSVLRKSGLCLFAILTLSGEFPCSASTPPPVPTSFQDLYTSLNNYLDSFNTTLNSQWNGVKYPVLFTANLWDASAAGGPQLTGANSLANVQAQLQELKAMGVQAVTVEVGFPMLYEPFFSSQSQYQQFVTFYQNVAASVRAQGLKLIVDNECLLVGKVLSGWNPAPFYATLNWEQYQEARAQTAVVIAQTMQPDYMVVLEEPDTEAMMTGQSAVNTVSGATSMLSLILSSLQQAGGPGVKVGAGVGTWLGQYQQFIQSFVTLPVDFIDMHVIPVNYSYLPNALAIASIAAAAGKPVTITQTWLHKVRDSELNVLTSDQILARDPFSFWAPLDAYFVQTMEKLAYCTQMTFLDIFQSIFFWAYLPYDVSTENLTPSQILSQATQQSQQNMMAASYTSTALSYYSSILPAPDTMPPSTPGNLAGSSYQPTQAYLTWNASTDNVGVAGYYVRRNGVTVATPVVRVPLADFAAASRALDCGAEAIIAPMINSESDARTFVAAAKYPPLGERSWGPYRAMALQGRSNAVDYLREANEGTLTLAMIETTAALANVDAIAATPGIDALFIGPYDLSTVLSGGKAQDVQAGEVERAIDQIRSEE